MKHYKRITIWENRRRRKFLQEFRNLVSEYFADTKHADLGLGLIEGKKAIELRPQINKLMNKAQITLLTAGWSPHLIVTPPPAIGGYRQNIDVLMNMFDLHNHQIPEDHVFDFIDRAIGNYEQDESAAKLRTWNPFFWLGLVFDWLASFPFRLLGRAGFDAQKVEQSVAGRLLKAFIYVIEGLAALLTVLQLTGLLRVVGTGSP